MKEKDFPNRINEKITGVKEVRLVGDNITPGVYTFQQAYKIADDLNLDLVEINGKQSPIICKILDYEKYLYELKRNEVKQKSPEVKEIRMSSQTDKHDLEFKIKHAIEFLKERDKVKVCILYRGREIVHKELGEQLLQAFCDGVKDFGKTDKPPVLEGKKLTVTINPK